MVYSTIFFIRKYLYQVRNMTVVIHSCDVFELLIFQCDTGLSVLNFLWNSVTVFFFLLFYFFHTEPPGDFLKLTITKQNSQKCWKWYGLCPLLKVVPWHIVVNFCVIRSIVDDLSHWHSYHIFFFVFNTKDRPISSRLTVSDLDICFPNFCLWRWFLWGL